VLLGPDGDALDGVEFGGEPNGVREFDVQPVATALDGARARVIEPSDGADDATNATRWRPCGDLPTVSSLNICAVTMVPTDV